MRERRHLIMYGKATKWIVCAAALALVSGCIAVGGTDTYTKPTLGRQLMDLKSAHDTGAISEQEYQVAKSDLLTRRYVDNTNR
jgi:hypothetical protein